MHRAASIVLACFLAGSLAVPETDARPTGTSPYSDDNGASSQDQDQGNYSYEPYSPEQLDNLLSPIALYPDPLLAQVMVAATFPDQIEEAARYVRAYGTNGIDDQYWDVSVKSVAHYPSVVEMMADKLDWTTALGQAYVNQSTEVSESIQRLRHLARNYGNLETTPQQEVILHDDYIGIYPYQPAYIYVPVYDPAIIYYRRPYWGSAIFFGTGFVVGAWLNLGWGWGGPGIYYTGWRHEGWYGGWVDRCRPSIHITNVYVNNRYTNITVNKTVINRTVNVNNINRYNYVHKNVTYNNVEHNNVRVNRVNNVNARQSNNNFNNNGRGNVPNGGRANAPNNKIMDRNIDRNNPRVDQFRGRETNPRSDRPPAVSRPNVTEPPRQFTPPARPNVTEPQRQFTPPARPNVTEPPRQFNPPPRPGNPPTRPGNVQQYRPAPQPEVRPGPHTFNRSEGNFNPGVASQRGQSSRAQVQQSRPAPPPRSNPQPRVQQSRPAPAPHEGRKP